MRSRQHRRTLTARPLALACCCALAGCTGVLNGDNVPGDSTSQGTSGAAAGGAASLAGAGGGASAGSGPVTPGPVALPYLTVKQYRNAVARVFGPTVNVPDLQSDDNPDFYAVIGAARGSMTEAAVSFFWEAAKSVAQQVTESAELRDKLLSCPAAPAVDAGCIADFLRDSGLRLFRRPLTADETSQYATLIQDTAHGDLWRGVRFALTAMLASPAFLYRHERTVADAGVPGGHKLDDHALASRLSFLLVNDGPDDELLERASAGELSDPAALAQQVERLYPLAMDSGLRQFFQEYLELDAAGLLDFDGEQDESIATAMRGEVLGIARDAVAPGADFRQLFTTRSTYVNGPLAKLYGLDGITGGQLVPVTLPADGKRGGLLTTGAFLTVEGAQDRTKPTNRGLYVQFRLMCTQVPDPPDNIPTLEDTGADPVATSVREALKLHQSEPTCAACHSLVDPIGIGMEDFDQFGRYRSTYIDGSAVDASSAWNGTPFVGAAALGALLSSDPRVAECMTKQLFRYANARLETGDGEAAVLQRLQQSFASQYAFKDLVSALVSSESFRFASQEEP